MKITILLTLALALSGTNLARAATAGSKNKEGNRHFAEGNYDEALKAYLEAQTKERDRPELLYNVGNTFIRQKKYEQALQSLRQATSKGNEGLQAESWFNAGNALFEMGKFGDSAQAYISRCASIRRIATLHGSELALRRVQGKAEAAGSGPESEEGKDSNQPQNQGSGPAAKVPGFRRSSPAPQQPADADRRRHRRTPGQL